MSFLVDGLSVAVLVGRRCNGEGELLAVGQDARADDRAFGQYTCQPNIAFDFKDPAVHHERQAIMLEDDLFGLDLGAVRQMHGQLRLDGVDVDGCL